FEANVNGVLRGYHKPIMLAGGLGNIDAAHSHKRELPPGTLLIQLGGPGLRIGMGGGAASSMGAGANVAELDFDSVQRDNAEIERRAQEVIERCWRLGADNVILSIRVVGAGGLWSGRPRLESSTGRSQRSTASAWSASARCAECGGADRSSGHVRARWGVVRSGCSVPTAGPARPWRSPSDSRLR